MSKRRHATDDRAQRFDLFGSRHAQVLNAVDGLECLGVEAKIGGVHDEDQVAVGMADQRLRAILKRCPSDRSGLLN